MSPKVKAFSIALALALIADQWSKIWVRAHLRPIYPQVKTVIAGYFELRYSENTAAAFGLLRGVFGARVLLLLFGIAALFVIVYYLRKAPPDARRIGAELGLITGGALGNLIDRLLYGHVTDFVVWKIGSYEWHTFNIADAALVVGVIGLLFDMRAPRQPSPAT
jgi:signal peptidase II